MKIKTTGPATIDFVSRDNETVVLAVKCDVDGFSLQETKTGMLLNRTRGAMDGIMIVTLDASQHAFEELNVTVVPNTPAEEASAVIEPEEELLPVVTKTDKRVTRKKKSTQQSK